MSQAIDKQLYDLQVLKMGIAEVKKKAFEIVKSKCEGNLKNKELMHEAYHQTGMSTSELRTIMSDKTVYYVEDAIKIVERDLAEK